MHIQQLRDLAAEFSRYGDAFSAFVILQALGFSIKMGDGGEFRSRVQAGAWFILPTIVASGLMYSALVWGCWSANAEITTAIEAADVRGAAQLTGNDNSKAANEGEAPPSLVRIAHRWQHRAWVTRIVTIWVATVCALLALLLNLHDPRK